MVEPGSQQPGRGSRKPLQRPKPQVPPPEPQPPRYSCASTAQGPHIVQEVGVAVPQPGHTLLSHRGVADHLLNQLLQGCVLGLQGTQA